MSITRLASDSGASAVVRIEGEMTIYRAVQLKEALLMPLASAQVLEVDLSRVTELDSSGVQLLMLAKLVAQTRGAGLRVVACSAEVLDVIELFDLSAYFGIQIVMP